MQHFSVANLLHVRRETNCCVCMNGTFLYTCPVISRYKGIYTRALVYTHTYSHIRTYTYAYTMNFFQFPCTSFTLKVWFASVYSSTRLKCRALRLTEKNPVKKHTSIHAVMIVHEDILSIIFLDTESKRNIILDVCKTE